MPSAGPFTCVIPARDAGRTIGEVLAAVFRSTLVPAEVIVVDDGSRDDTALVAGRYPCRILRVDIRGGDMPPRLAGAAAAATPLLAFIDADVRVRRDTFERLVAKFSDPAVDAVTGLLARASESQSFASAFKNEYMNYIFLRQPRRATFLYGSIWAVRRSSLPRFELLAKPFGNRVTDTELGLELTRQGGRIVLDHGLEVEHLKEYSIRSLLANDFVIPFSFALAWLRYGSLASLARTGRFSHVSVAQVAATAAASCASALGAAALLSRSAWLLATAAGLLAFFFLYWAPFLARVRKRGAVFTACAALLLPLDATVMFCGMVSGFASALLRRWFPARTLGHAHSPV